MVSPVIDEIMQEYGNSIKFVQLCTDENPETVQLLNVKSIPTVMLFKNEESVVTIVGAFAKNALVTSLRKHVDL